MLFLILKKFHSGQNNYHPLREHLNFIKYFKKKCLIANVWNKTCNSIKNLIHILDLFRLTTNITCNQNDFLLWWLRVDIRLRNEIQKYRNLFSPQVIILQQIFYFQYFIYFCAMFDFQIFHKYIKIRSLVVIFNYIVWF